LKPGLKRSTHYREQRQKQEMPPDSMRSEVQHKSLFKRQRQRQNRLQLFLLLTLQRLHGRLRRIPGGPRRGPSLVRMLHQRNRKASFQYLRFEKLLSCVMGLSGVRSCLHYACYISFVTEIKDAIGAESRMYLQDLWRA
jgi:hypothetical protein